MALNHITIMGRLTRDPELRRTPNGVAVTSITLAVDRDIKEQNGERQTDFIDVVAWRGTAEFVAKHFSKGRMAIADGRLQIREWTDKDGNKRRTAEVKAENLYFGDSKRDTEESSAPASYGGGAYESTPTGFYGGYSAPTNSFAMQDDGDDSDLPF